jgi:hypothetical protein
MTDVEMSQEDAAVGFFPHFSVLSVKTYCVEGM